MIRRIRNYAKYTSNFLRPEITVPKKNRFCSAITSPLPFSFSFQVTISLIDVNNQSPEFVTSNLTSILENSPSNAVVTAVKAIDRDEGRNGHVEYSLLVDLDDQPFTLGPVDGVLRVAGPLDREQRSNYTLRVLAKDRGEPSRSTVQNLVVVILDENDNSPVFDPRHYSANVAENASIGASVLQVSVRSKQLE